MDLTSTHINSHVLLKDLPIKPKKTTQKDIGRFCRLKELADGQKDHERALEFKAQEILATRQHQHKGLAKVLPWCFETFSNYGRSVLRPLVGLIWVWGMFGLIYQSISQNASGDWQKLHESLVFSASQMFPLIPGFCESREGALGMLFPSLSSEPFLPLWLSALAFFQSLLAIIFFFLLGLALRNQFRL